jgi:cell division protein FtsI (penicillin-binding protein 3)
MIPPQSVKRTVQRPTDSNRRIQIWYGVLLLIVGIFGARLFYLQIIRHDYYKKAALSDQLKEYSIAPDRGIIEAHEGDGTVPIVLNEKLYTLYADPVFVRKPEESALKLTAVTHGDANEYIKLMKTPHSRYAVLAKRLSEAEKNQITSMKLAGVGLQAQSYRTYPQGTLAAQLLGFVNGDGVGTYGVEQALNKQLTGHDGLLKAITDAAGVPLAASKDNIQINPVSGKKVLLTIDAAMQKQLENLLKQGLDNAKSKSGSALIIDPSNGAIKAMANLPTYEPSQYYKQSDPNIFNNSAVSEPLEVGSIMKTLTASAALDLGVINPDTSYQDPSVWPLDGHSITNIEEDGGPGTHNIADILNLSINTGATWMLMQMGGQTGVVNQKARDRWHDYMVNHFNLGKPTGVEQGYEASGYVPDPDKGYALQLTYANTAFGQAMTATPLQMGAALASVINGGTYYQPRLVDKTTSQDGKTEVKKPVVVRTGAVSTKVSGEIQSLLEYVVKGHLDEGFSYLKFPDNYIVGGKTGTAQIANPAGGYYTDKYNGTYMGFVGGDHPQYVIVVRVSDPGVGGYAGSQAAQPLFASLAHMLINDFNVTPKTGP